MQHLHLPGTANLQPWINKNIHIDWHWVHTKVTPGNYSTALTRYHACALAERDINIPIVTRRNPWIKNNASPCNSYLPMATTVQVNLHYYSYAFNRSTSDGHQHI